MPAPPPVRPPPSVATASSIEDLTTEDIVFGAICMATGLLMCVAGYMVFTVLTFLAGFFTGYWVCFAIMESIDVQYGEQEELIIFLSCLAAGVLIGLLVVYFSSVGVFFVGAEAGFVLACWILSFVDADAPIQQTTYRWILIAGIVRERFSRHALFVSMRRPPHCPCLTRAFGLGHAAQALVVGIVAVCIQRPMVIAGSSVLGAYLLFYGIDVFAQTGYAATMDAILRGEPVPTPLNTPTIAMLASAAVAALLGMVIQARISRDKDHTKVAPRNEYVQIN